MVKVFKKDNSTCDDCEKQHRYVISMKNNILYLCEEHYDEILDIFRERIDKLHKKYEIQSEGL